MTLLKANPKGGPKMRPGNYPFDWDEDNRTGFRVGYCDCGQKIIVPIREAESMAEVFSGQIDSFYDKFREMAKPKKTLREYLIEFLGGQVRQDNPEQALHAPSEIFYRK